MLPTCANCWPVARARALGDRDRVRREVHEDVVAAVDAAQHDVVPGASGLELDPGDGPRDGGDHGRALGGGDVLALVDVALAAGAEAGVLAAEVVRALDGEDARAATGGGGGTRTVSRSRPEAVAVRRSPWPASSNAWSVAVYSPAGSSPALGVQMYS